MLGLASDRHAVAFWRMAPDPAPKRLSEQVALGIALRRLRKRADLTQEAAATQADVVVQSWRRYEAGQRDLSLAKVTRLAGAIGFNQEQLLAELAVVTGEAAEPSTAPVERAFEVAVHGHGRAGVTGGAVNDFDGRPHRKRDLSWLFDGELEWMDVGGESMTGYVEPGMMVGYKRGTWPRRGDGCVVEMHTGERLIKEYVGGDEHNIIVSQRFPAAELTIRRAEVRGVYKIRARID